MKRTVTNKTGLPLPFVIAVENDPYDPNDGGQQSDFTITGLLQPARISQMMKTANLVEDAADLLFSLQGQLIHDMLQRAAKDLEPMGWIIEKRFYKTYIVDDKPYVVSAKIDAFDSIEGLLTDYKYSTMAAATHDIKPEHLWQVNFQAELLRSHGFEVRKASVTILMRDWSAMRHPAPPAPVVMKSVTMLKSEQINAWVVERIRAHVAAQTTLPECTNEEKWSRPTFALMKTKDMKRATKVCDTRAEAEWMVHTSHQGYLIVERPGIPIRCQRYCPVREICPEGLKARVRLHSGSIDEDGLTKVS
jgi:hypothetical protein